MPGPLRVVMDTNVVLSALLFQRGRLSLIRQLWQTGQVEPLVSSTTVSELIRALGYPKFKLTAVEREELLADYLPWCTVVDVPNPPPVIPACRDHNDIPFLELAASAHADALVTGDKDLLALTDSFETRILTPELFLAEIA